MNGDSGASVVPPPDAWRADRPSRGRWPSAHTHQQPRERNRGNASVWALPIDLLPERMGETRQVRIKAR
ncbi:MAG: hypothetical protein ACK5F5_09070 [Gammaproteobacteria bacterium]|jgi:hypothetical protein